MYNRFANPFQTRELLAKHLKRYYARGDYQLIIDYERPGGVVAVYYVRLYKNPNQGATFSRLIRHKSIEIPERLYRELQEMSFGDNLKDINTFIDCLFTRQEIIDELLTTLK